MPAGTTVRALFDCRGDDETELSFAKGDVIIGCLPAQDDGWLIGTLQSTGARGLFPSNYAEPIVLTERITPPKLQSASSSSQANVRSSPDETHSGTKWPPKSTDALKDSAGPTLTESKQNTPSLKRGATLGSISPNSDSEPGVGKIPIAELAARFSPARPQTNSSSAVKSRAAAFESSAASAKPAPVLPAKPAVISANSPFAPAAGPTKKPPPAPIPKPTTLSSRTVELAEPTTKDESPKPPVEETVVPKKAPALPSRTSAASSTGSAFPASLPRPSLPSRTNIADMLSKAEITPPPPRPQLPDRSVEPTKPSRPSLPARTNSVSLPKPEMAERGKVEPPIPLPPRDAVPSSMSKTTSPIPAETERKYMNLFRTLSDPATKTVSGNNVREVWTRSGLSNDILAACWELADADEDGALAEGEFLVGMVLVDGARDGNTVPDKLTRELESLLRRR